MIAGRRLIAVIVLIAFGGCAASATVTRTDGIEMDAVIERSDADALYLRDDQGRLQRVGRDNVKAIDHPGNAEMVVGGLLLGIFAAFAIAFRNGSNGQVILPPAIVAGVPGMVLLVSGVGQYTTSIEAARAFEKPTSRP
ncbi:MAG TPA: hypothetical protein VKQ32_29165 [Polyangia bacterium]|nr:hypothetical protein [Polyangia bacterium]